MTTGIILFDDAEELDFAGPWEVFTTAAMMKGDGKVVTIAEHDRPVRCAKGMRVVPDHTFANAPALDVLLIPGGLGTRREEENPTLLEFVRRAATNARWITSVCTGAAILAAAGLVRGKRVTTHFSYVETLRARPDLTVLEGPRWVVDGNVVTSAGVSAGIDMALWLVGQLESPDFARGVQRWIEYNPAPPYAAEL